MKKLITACLLAALLLCSCNGSGGSSSEQVPAPSTESLSESEPESLSSQESEIEETPSEAPSEAPEPVDPALLLGDWYADMGEQMVIVLKVNDEQNMAYLYGKYATEGSAYFSGAYTVEGDLLKLDLRDGIVEEGEEGDPFVSTLKISIEDGKLIAEHVEGELFKGWDGTAPLTLVREEDLNI